MVDMEALRQRIEALAPERSADPASAIALFDAAFALEARFSEVLGLAAPQEWPARAELSARCVALVRAWVPRVDLGTLRALDWRANDRRTPLDLSARKAELKREAGLVLPDRQAALAPYEPLPSVDGLEPVAAFYVEGRLTVGEYPETGVTVEALPGVWLAYVRAVEGDEEVTSELLAVHADRLDRLTDLRGDLRRLPHELSITAARIAVADARALEDEDLVESLAGNYVDQFCGHAAQILLDGDGSAVMSVAEENGHVVLLLVTT